MVGACALAVVREQVMQRADAEKRGAGLARQRAGAAERGEVADPLVAVALQRIELRRDAEAPPERRLGEMGFGRRDDERAFDAVDDQAVAADRQVGQGDQPFEDRPPVGERDAARFARLGAERQRAAVFGQDRRVDRPRRFGRVGAQRHEARRVEAADVGHRQASRARLGDELGEALAHLRLRRGGKAQSLQQRKLRLGRNDASVDP